MMRGQVLLWTPPWEATADAGAHSDFSLPVDPDAAGKILQGVTTEVVGNCGLGLQPAYAQVDALYDRILPLVGELGLFTLEEAMHRMTGMVARKLGLPDRGAHVLINGAHAVKDRKATGASAGAVLAKPAA
jgi:N-acyl-D-aspartate/D-glutamate deacylase